MTADRRRMLFALVALFVLAPTLAAVVIGALLLVGVDPHLVFLPGHVLKSRLEAIGLHPSNRVGVLATVGFFWAIVVLVWLALRRILRDKNERDDRGRSSLSDGAG